ncbi:MAG: hypothetical protein K0Q80_1729, partial [Microvirga sp.]|nr:hypothetical protein [Microvirga sp.]
RMSDEARVALDMWCGFGFTPFEGYDVMAGLVPAIHVLGPDDMDRSPEQVLDDQGEAPKTCAKIIRPDRHLLDVGRRPI